MVKPQPDRHDLIVSTKPLPFPPETDMEEPSSISFFAKEVQAKNQPPDYTVFVIL